MPSGAVSPTGRHWLRGTWQDRDGAVLAVGETNRHDGEGRKLTLHYDGLPGPVETDIAGAPHKDFRDRASIRKFFAHHDLKAGEKIAIEKKSDYEYRILPAR